MRRRERAEKSLSTAIYGIYGGNREQEPINYIGKEQAEPLGGKYNGKNDREESQVNRIKQSRKLTMMLRVLS